jgi:tetratricopeptide (TPR) repeat protein
MKTIAVSFSLVCLLAMDASARVWTDATGKMQIEAEYVGLQDGQVMLRVAETGKLATVPLDKLSDTDRQYVQSLPADAGGLLAKDEQKSEPQPIVVDTSGDDRFSEAIRQNPNDPDAYNTRGMALLNRGQADEAIPFFNKALELNPKSEVAYTERGRAKMKLEDAAGAHDDFTKAIELNPKFAPAYRKRAENVPDYYKTPKGQALLDQHEGEARKRRDAIAQKYLQKFPWQPPNSTTHRALDSAAIRNIANLDYAMADQLEREYVRGDWGGGVAIGGGGVGIGVGTAVAGPGVVVGPPLAVYPAVATKGETISLVANPSEMIKGMPQKVDPKNPPKRGAVPTAAQLQDIASVDFYRDVNGNGNLEKDNDQYLESDLDGSDGFSIEVSTSEFPLGPQNYFAVPKGADTPGSTAALTLSENLLKAVAKSERALAEQSQTASKTSGLTAQSADALGTEQMRLARVVNEISQDLKTSAPEVAAMLNEAKKDIAQTQAQLRAAKLKPELSQTPAGKAADSAQSVAEQLERAVAALSEKTGSSQEENGEEGSTSGEEGSTSGEAKPAKPPTGEANAGQAVAGSGEIVPPKSGGPGGPGKGGPGGGGPGGGDDDGPAVVNNYYGDDHDVVADRARDYVDDQDYDRAILEYDRLLRDRPYDVRYLRDRAHSYLASGGYDYAIRDYSQAISLAPRNADFYYNRGCAHQAAGNLQLAVDDFTMSIQLDELRKLGNLAYNNRGTTYAQRGEFELAVADFDEAIKINPNDRLAYHNRALAYKKLDKLTEAAADLERAKQLSP